MLPKGLEGPLSRVRVKAFTLVTWHGLCHDLMVLESHSPLLRASMCQVLSGHMRLHLAEAEEKAGADCSDCGLLCPKRAFEELPGPEPLCRLWLRPRGRHHCTRERGPGFVLVPTPTLSL